ncbi:hypothetical protein P3T76_005893 [Phytophthora citrophthora]|uniref:Uncharacterized protein n=1 Tax=Phytophthora citrophthora TaxID=4793 RepID=A0AAD9GPV5_9STRA|nr:hypothetical protein P3T76_005893 [Phytophthora citrophthora]
MLPFRIGTGRIPRVMGHGTTVIDIRGGLARSFEKKRQEVVKQVRVSLSELNSTRQKKPYDQKRSPVMLPWGT